MPILVLVLAVLLPLTALPGETAAQAFELRMVIANGVSCRSEPRVDAPLERRFEAGGLIAAVEEISGDEGVWYLDRTHARGGSQGCWLYGPLTTPFDRSNPEPALLAAADHILSRGDERVPFVEFAAIENVLVETHRGAHGPTAIESSPLLQLRRLQVIDRAVRAPGADRWTVARDPLKVAWMRAHEDVIRPFEPAGRWIMEPDAYWRLFEEHRETEAAEEIAWAAARTSPGVDECYVDCLLDLIRQTYARYWREYPTGPHVQEALARSMEIAGHGLDPQLCEWTDASRRQEIVRDLRDSLAAVRAAGKQALLSRVQEIERICG